MPAARSTDTYCLAGFAVMAVTSLLIVWTTIVRDDGNGIAFFGPVFTAAACAFVARGRAEGMARAMVATAGVQAVFGALLATAPITQEPGRVAIGVGVFCLLWLGSAGLFWRSARMEAAA